MHFPSVGARVLQAALLCLSTLPAMQAADAIVRREQVEVAAAPIKATVLHGADSEGTWEDYVSRHGDSHISMQVGVNGLPSFEEGLRQTEEGSVNMEKVVIATDYAGENTPLLVITPRAQ
mmetsp:Transcript_33072/g.75414  ORF Transcript_33072/g.75414 Transcript_33072/m.75414 type:complete len:120 (-) Transcript_33072:74-433(-)